MSHFVKCDRCSVEDSVLGTVTLPPGWQKICGADLCEPCCTLVRDFIRFKPSDAEKLPVEPIEPIEPLPPAGDKLFETAPEVKHEKTDPAPAPSTENPEAPSPRESAQGQKAPEALGTAPVETTVEERVRTRAASKRKKLLGQDALLTSKRTPAAGEVQP